MTARRMAGLRDSGWNFVSDHVAVRRSRRFRTNTVAVVDDNRVLLVDPAWDPDELDIIAASLAEHVVVVGFATHAHHDHLLWHPALGTAPRWASPTTARIAAQSRETLRREWGHADRPDLVDLIGGVTALGSGLIPWDGPRVQLLTHNAHLDGHTALWVDDDRVLIAGDMLSDLELPLPENDSIDAYAVGLATLRPYATHAAVVVPGHGDPGTDGLERWRADSRYIDQLSVGLDPGDPRRENAGMEKAHRLSLALAARGV